MKGVPLSALVTLVVLLLVLPALSPSPLPSSSGVEAAAADAEAAPWDGIVGFLQTVARLQQRRAEPESVEEDDGQPPRKIVYAVEEQVSGDEVKSNGSVIIYDSLQDGMKQPSDSGREKRFLESETAISRKRRSADSSKHVDEQTGRNAVGPRPYLIGRKLWYVPLWFGIYLILYITALTVKSVARHRIKYPTLVSEDDLLAKRRNGYTKPDSLTRRVTNAISNGEQRYQQYWSM